MMITGILTGKNIQIFQKPKKSKNQAIGYKHSHPLNNLTLPSAGCYNHVKISFTRQQDKTLQDQAFELIKKEIFSNTKDCRNKGLQSLQKLVKANNEAPANTLIKQLFNDIKNEPKAECRVIYVQSLGIIGESQSKKSGEVALDYLNKMADDPDQSVKYAIIKAVCDIWATHKELKTKALKAFDKLKQNSGPNTKVELAKALGELGKKHQVCIKILDELKSDEDDSVKKAAEEYIKNIKATYENSTKTKK